MCNEGLFTDFAELRINYGRSRVCAIVSFEFRTKIWIKCLFRYSDYSDKYKHAVASTATEYLTVTTLRLLHSHNESKTPTLHTSKSD